MPGTSDQFHSPEAAESAISTLSSSDIVRLRQFANLRVVFKGSKLSADDLIDEAVKKTLEGERLWNMKLSIVQHLIGVMRSVAGDNRRSLPVRSEVYIEDVSPNGVDEVAGAASSTTEPDRTYQSNSEFTYIFDLFKGDEQATKVLKGLYHEETSQETVRKRDISQNEYDAALKRIRRKMLQKRKDGET